jgi:hypothetical protein
MQSLNSDSSDLMIPKYLIHGPSRAILAPKLAYLPAILTVSTL